MQSSLTLDDDRRHMHHALHLAARALGRTAPNPAVGCVIVSDAGAVLGRGWTGIGGRPHAETVALAQAGAYARGATAYVTLEPCAHHGATPPCAEALIAAGVGRVVGALRDPDPRVYGKGFEKLSRAGIEIAEGVCEDEARMLNAGFISRVTRVRPLVMLKIAQSADGYVTDPEHKARWITSDSARRHGHFLRARSDAIMVGIGTVLADDPLLTCRLEGLEDRSPLRIVLDTRLRLPATSQLARTAGQAPVLVFTAADNGGALRRQGVEIARVAAGADGRPDLEAVLKALGARGLTRLLVEGGPTVHAALLARGLADVIHLYSSPGVLGGGLPSAPLPNPACLTPIGREALGPDLLESFAVTG